MFAIILFAIIGASINANWLYWCIYGLFCTNIIFKSLED